ATGSLGVIPLPKFASSLSVAPNVLAGGTSTAGILHFAMPALSQGTASSIAMTITPAGGSTTPVTKTGSVAFAPADLATRAHVDPPSTTISAASKVYTYSLTATNANGDASAATTTTVTSYPTGGNLGAPRIGGTATLLPNGKVLLVGGGSKLSQGICTYDA